MKLKKLLLFSLSLVFALSLTFGLGGAFKAFAANGETGPKLFTGARVTLTEDIVTKFEYTAPAGYTSASYTFTYRDETTEAKTATINKGENTIEFAQSNPARIGETITANLTLTGEGKEPVTDTCEFSVADYLGTLLTAAPSTFTEIKNAGTVRRNAHVSGKPRQLFRKNAGIYRSCRYFFRAVDDGNGQEFCRLR